MKTEVGVKICLKKCPICIQTRVSTVTHCCFSVSRKLISLCLTNTHTQHTCMHTHIHIRIHAYKTHSHRGMFINTLLRYIIRKLSTQCNHIKWDKLEILLQLLTTKTVFFKNKLKSISQLLMKCISWSFFTF